MYVLHKRHGQFRGTQFLISVLNSFRFVEFLHSSVKIIHNFGPTTEIVSVHNTPFYDYQA